jgi:hypothetical protein
VLPKWVPKGGRPWPGLPSIENAQLVSQASCANRRGAPVGTGGMPGVAPQLPDQTEQAAPKGGDTY